MTYSLSDVPELDVLSERELEVFEYLVEGYTNVAIGHYLDVSPHTIKQHVTQITGKLSPHIHNDDRHSFRPLVTAWYWKTQLERTRTMPIYDPLDLHKGRRYRRDTSGDEVFDFHATWNPIEEERTEAEKRITGEFRDALKRSLDGGYGADEGHGSK